MAAQIEVLRAPAGHRFRFVLFDFDGTLSIIRQGWQDVMTGMMLEFLHNLPTGMALPQLRAMIEDEIARQTGRQTIYQMIYLREQVGRFGGQPLTAAQYKADFNRRLLDSIHQRRQSLADGSIDPRRMLLPGSQPLLEALSGRGDLTLCLASGTDEQYVREEAALLRVERYFGRHIYGAREDYQNSEKRQVIQRLIAENRVTGPEFVVFGDGFVEIENAREIGGYAVGVASDETAGGTTVNAWKRDRLLKAGADMIVPDFACHEELMRLLFEERA